MYSRLLQINHQARHSVFLFGARGTGKTAWVKQRFPEALYFDLLDDDLYAEFLARPTRLGERIPGEFNQWIIYAVWWATTIH